MKKRLIVSAAALALSTGAALTQPEALPYCLNLKHIVLLAASNDKFASIRAQQREGNFWGTSLPLTGWKNCSVYGSRTYTCDSEEVIPSPIDQNPCAHWRNPMDMILQG